MSSSSARPSSGGNLLPPPSRTRLVTIVAHVDHGKTTLADNLIESNGIISERLAGTVRYLDSLEEEQRRGITMRTSGIWLRWGWGVPKGHRDRGKKGDKKEVRDLVVHLLDSPGHVDFSPEVTASLLLSDTSLLVIDAVEGLCARTHSILREAYAARQAPILVINKVDRLCGVGGGGLGLTEEEAYVRLRGVVESVNAACAALMAASHSDREGAGAEAGTGAAVELSPAAERRKGGKRPIAARNGAKSTAATSPKDADGDAHGHKPDEEEVRWTFDPVRGNVVFASALHGWGFTVPSLARSLFKSGAVRIRAPILRQYLWGDFRYNEETKKVVKWKRGSGDPLFAEFGLRPLWGAYGGISAAAASLGLSAGQTSGGGGAAIGSNGGGTAGGANRKIRADSPGMAQTWAAVIAGHTLPTSGKTAHLLPSTAEEWQRVLQRTGASSEESVSRAVLRRYRPLSDAVLDCVGEFGIPPAEAQGEVRGRALGLRPIPEAAVAEEERAEYEAVRAAASECSPSEEAPAVAHVCKFAPTSRSYVTDSGLPPMDPDDADGGGMIMGIARVLSGTLRSGAEYYAYGPRLSPPQNGGEPPPKRRVRLYLLMGSSFVHVPSVPAGHICAVYDLEDLQLKTCTLSDSPHCTPMAGFDRGLRPLVKVNVEAERAADTDALERGLVKLALADASVEVTATSRGERLLACLGEIHLEQSIHDLETIYCAGGGGESGKGGSGTAGGIELRVSDPIVEFGESTTWFEGEDSTDPAQFFCESEDTAKSPPLRQMSVPPYCYEEGLAGARRGRCRAVLSGRPAAISVRVLPLSAGAFACLRDGKVTADDDGDGGGDGGAEEDGGGGNGGNGCAAAARADLLRLGRALGCHCAGAAAAEGGASSAAVEDVLRALSGAVCALDSNGNALLETDGMRDGTAVKAVLSDDGEVHVPPPAFDPTAKAGGTMSRNSSDQQLRRREEEDGGGRRDGDGVDGAPAAAAARGREEYDAVRERIRRGGIAASSPPSGSGSAPSKAEDGVSPLNADDDGASSDADDRAGADADAAAAEIWRSEMRGSAVAGFKLAMRAGPLCEEPVRGALVVLEGVEIALAAEDRRPRRHPRGRKTEEDGEGEGGGNGAPTPPPTPTPSSSFSPVKPVGGGVVLSALRSGIRSALLSRPARLVEALLKLTLHSSLAGLGPLHAVLNRRRGRVLADDMVEGTDLLRVTASLPQAESFGLSSELLEKSSGEVTAPELVFWTWRVLEEDPFWIPETEEEREDFGEILNSGDSSTGLDNHALGYIRAVRERKGLLVDSKKIVVAAEKQRTLARKK